QPAMRGGNRLFAAFDCDIHQRTSIRLERGRPVTCAPWVKKKSSPSGNWAPFWAKNAGTGKAKAKGAANPGPDSVTGCASIGPSTISVVARSGYSGVPIANRASNGCSDDQSPNAKAASAGSWV